MPSESTKQNNGFITFAIGLGKNNIGFIAFAIGTFKNKNCFITFAIGIKATEKAVTKSKSDDAG